MMKTQEGMRGKPDLNEYHTRGRKCTHCGKRGRAKCKAGVCLNFCCMTKKLATSAGH
jgi:hypothetical protein